MASNSERTHAKNLENIHIANVTINTVTNFDTSNPIIAKTALEDFETGFAARGQTVNETYTNEKNAIAAQTAGFKLVREKVTRILNAAKAQGLSPEAIEQLKEKVRRVRGVRVSDKTPDNPATPEDESRSNHSVAQTSIAGILETLDLIDQQLKKDAKYNPNETEFKPASITSWVAGLRDLRNARLDAQAAALNARQDRDAYGFGKESGIITRMNMVKSYLETILPKSDARYKKIKGLKFVDITNK